MEKEIYIEFEKVSKSFRDIKAVNELSFTIFKGDIYGFLGPNGSGKSTSIRMLLSLISPDSGTIRLFGKDLSFHRYQTLSRIGALIEKPDFYKYLSARKNLEILARISKVKNISRKVDEVLDLVGLLPRADSKVKTFSQGMKQRLGIAQTLLHDPDLIILDEPANGLDPQGHKEIRMLINTLTTEKKITLLMSSHLLNEIEESCNRMIIINKGSKVVEGEVKSLLNTEEMNVEFSLDDVTKAMSAISQTQWSNYFNYTEGSSLFFKMNQKEIPELATFFIQNGLKIFSIKPLRTLEEYFIKLTTDDRAG
ncbi:MAG: ABC transporter ATP-binding protein [Sphingobacteriales bacterium]|nr:ABC transporter ATP-binding protein [Sphingobacteriales bacterium]